MKKLLYIALLGLLSFSLLGCNSLVYDNELPITAYELFNYHVVGEKEIVDINYDILGEAGLIYDKIIYNIDNEDVVRVLSDGNIKATNPGKAEVTATIFYDRIAIANVAIGYFVVLDLESVEYETINNYTEFTTKIINNPSGNFYLNANITFPEDFLYTPIPEFTGVLINPYGYTISGLNFEDAGGAGLFRSISHAYIDGLILDDIDITGAYVGAIAAESEFSYIGFVHITDARLTSTSGTCGGLVGISFNTVYRKVSFEGEIVSASNAGGIAGETDNGKLNESYYKENLVIYSYADADITVTDDTKHTGGLVGYNKSYGVFESSFSVGSLTGDNLYNIAYNEDASLVYYLSMYSGIDIVIIDQGKFASRSLYVLSNEDFRTGSVLPGLESFTFEAGELPKN